MTKTIDIPIAGPAASKVPQLEHEFALSGLRVIALPPGEVEVTFALDPHVVDINLNAVPCELALNSDRLRKFDAPMNSAAWAVPGTEIKLRTCNVDWGILVELEADGAERVMADALDGRTLPRSYTSYRPAAQAAILARHLIGHMRFGTPDRLFVEGLGLAILSGALNVAQTGTEQRTGPATMGTDTRIARAIDYIEAHLAEDLSVAELARAAAMSPSWFQSCFRAAIGRPVFAYVRDRRLERARTLLADRRLSLSQIAFACGFSSHSHMTRLFTARYGASPNEMRR